MTLAEIGPREVVPLRNMPAEVPVNPYPLMYDRFAWFMAQLHDEAGHPLFVDAHQEEWADLMQNNPLLCLLAPRDHGKTYCEVCYILWRVWKHNRDRETGELLDGNPEGRLQIVLFADTIGQAEIFFDLFQSLFLGNGQLFADLFPATTARNGRRDVWSKRRARLINGADVIIRGYRTSTRGLHPEIIILDDVLSDENTQTAYQREKTWRYLIATLMPMNAKQYIVVGTAMHYDDLLHRLKPDKSKAPMVVRNRKVRFKWVRYKAVNWENKKVLWARQHSYDDLLGRRDQQPVIFAREWQNDPVDDTASLFPWNLTGLALEPGTDDDPLTFVTQYRKAADEVVVLGSDFAMSESVGADYCVIWVAALNTQTMKRRILWGVREKGWGYEQQVNMLRFACRAFGVDIGVMEENSFQKWVHAETMKYPETSGRILGHRTGAEKSDLAEGVPSMKISLTQQLWTFPTGDAQCRALAHQWQAEMSAFGWFNDKLQGVGEHDDTVMAFWLLDRAVRRVLDWLSKGPAEEVIHGEDIGIERVRIGADY